MIKKIDKNKFINSFKSDKKHSLKYYIIILPDKLGRLFINKISKNNFPLGKIYELIFKNLLDNEI